MPEPKFPSDVAGPPRPADLSSEIVATIQRQADERVTCRHVCGSRYRCNWWGPQSTVGYDNPMMHGLLVTTHPVRKSRFLSVTRSDRGLVIEDCGLSGTSENWCGPDIAQIYKGTK